LVQHNYEDAVQYIALSTNDTKENIKRKYQAYLHEVKIGRLVMGKAKEEEVTFSWFSDSDSDSSDRNYM